MKRIRGDQFRRQRRSNIDIIGGHRDENKLKEQNKQQIYNLRKYFPN